MKIYKPSLPNLNLSSKWSRLKDKLPARKSQTPNGSQTSTPSAVPDINLEAVVLALAQMMPPSQIQRWKDRSVGVPELGNFVTMIAKKQNQEDTEELGKKVSLYLLALSLVHKIHSDELEDIISTGIMARNMDLVFALEWMRGVYHDSVKIIHS